MKPISMILIGAGQRGQVYAAYAHEHPRELRLVGLADPDRGRADHVARLCSLPAADCHRDWRGLLALPRLADLAVIACPDQLHFETAMAALERGYDLLLEKPIATRLDQCMALAREARARGRQVVVCHVLRYTSFFTRLKDVIDSGELGRVISIQHTEGVGHWHQAHSFVRGNWGNSGRSSPMILAKSSHDMDILSWLAGASCARVSSFGSLSWFRAENAPAGAPERCDQGCPAERGCPYFAPRYYLRQGDGLAAALRKVVCLAEDEPSLLEALRTGPYGRCVYRCDNDVVDHQVCSLEFEGGITASFTMSAFAAPGRHINVMGSRAQLRGDAEKDELEIRDFLSGETRSFLSGSTGGNHGGGDEGMMRELCAFLAGGRRPAHLSTIEVSIESHLMAFASEESRVQGRTVELAALHGAMAE